MVDSTFTRGCSFVGYVNGCELLKMLVVMANTKLFVELRRTCIGNIFSKLRNPWDSQEFLQCQ